MSLESHIKQLENKCIKVEEELKSAYLHHQPTADLKKKRLLLEDEIAQLVKKAA